MMKQILNLKIKITHDSLSKLEQNLEKISGDINGKLPQHIWEEFQQRTERKYITKYEEVKSRNIQKLNRLKNQMKETLVIQDNWLKNLTDIDIPTDIESFLL
ncbi:hypothetical protein JTB14_000576 [Gonioctena quinquepunctata]|nr:hypothetical protein JTB14_000576 [Gonioctena quinquepunctata]